MAFALPIAALAISAVGAFASYQGAQNQAKAAKAAGEYNAKVAQENARIAQDQANFEASRIREQNRRIISSQVAGYAKAGVTLDETASDVITDSATNGELNALGAEYQGKVAFTRGTNEANNLLATSSNQASAYRSQGFSTVLTGLSGIAGTAYNYWGPKNTDYPKMEG